VPVRPAFNPLHGSAVMRSGTRDARTAGTRPAKPSPNSSVAFLANTGAPANADRGSCIRVGTGMHLRGRARLGDCRVAPSAAAAHLDGEAVNGLRVALAFDLQFYACPDRDAEPVRHALREHDLTSRGLGL
jgi:hypothetical protein